MKNYTLTILNFEDGKVYQHILNEKSRYFKTDKRFVFLIDNFCKDYNLNIKSIEYMLSNKEGINNLIERNIDPMPFNLAKINNY